jgi:hypothetical protein
MEGRQNDRTISAMITRVLAMGLGKHHDCGLAKVTVLTDGYLRYII